MANVKNFGLVGVGSDLQLGKAGARIKQSEGAFSLRNAADSANAALTLAGLTSSAGNITLTTGNLVVSDTAATIGIGGATFSRHASGTLQADGTGAFMVPNGTTLQRPTGAVGMVRSNSSNSNSLEFFDGTNWLTIATGGNTGALQTEIDNIETSLGAGITSSGTFNAAGFTGAGLGSVTSFTDAINTVANNIAAKDTLDEIFPSTAVGNVIYANSSNQWAQAVPSSTSGVQAYDAGLAALAAKTTTGIMVQTGNDTYASRSLVQPAAGITISDADGVAGNPTFALAGDLAGVEGLTGTGYAIRTGDGTWTTRTIAGTAGNIVVTNGDGVSSNTDIDLATVTQADSGNFVKVTLDTKGRVTGNTAVTAGDITPLVDGTYLRRDGTNSMSGNLNVNNNKIVNLAEPTVASDAATKNYVDNAVTGLSWKQAAHVLAASNVPLTGSTPLIIDGQTLADQERVLLINQTDSYEEGIYVVTITGGSYTMARAGDANTFQELNGAAVFVQTGTVYADSGWVQTATLTSLTTGNTQNWIQFSGAGAYVGGTGIDITGNVISARLGAGITNLPTGEIGIDVASGKAVQLTGTLTGSQLTFVLDADSGLSQSADGLKIAAGAVTNAMLTNSTITLNADSGTQDPLSLGGTLLIAGTSGQGISTAVTNDTITITASNASDTQKGVASFSAAQFTVTNGAVALDTVAIADGGTGKTSFNANQIHYGDFQQTSSLTYTLTGVGSDQPTLTVGNAVMGSAGVDSQITATGTNGDLVLMPNGSGSVVIGPSGGGIVQSDAGQALTVRGNNGLTLESGTNGQDIVMLVPSGTGTKVTIGGASAADYATSLADADLTNKKYVDDAIQSGAASGSIKAVKATVDLSSAGATNIGAALPAGATILRVKVNVTSADTATGNLTVGKSGNAAAYMADSENDTQSTGLYVAETYSTEGSSVQVIATVGGTPGGAGSANVIVEYQVA